MCKLYFTMFHLASGQKRMPTCNLQLPNLNIQIPGFCCIADDVQNRVPVASGKAAA